MTDKIVYKSGYKYQLQENYTVFTGIIPERLINTEYLILTLNGLLTIRRGYAWDGPSGPAIDTVNFMRGSLVHDGLCQLMRELYLDRTQHLDSAARLLQKMCIEDGMTKLRAWWVYQGVKLFGNVDADPADNK